MMGYEHMCICNYLQLILIGELRRMLIGEISVVIHCYAEYFLSRSCGIVTHESLHFMIFVVDFASKCHCIEANQFVLTSFNIFH